MAGKKGIRTRKLEAKLPLRGQEFTFRLHTRPLSLGDHVVRYYWMDGSKLRSMKSPAAQAQFGQIVDFWWTAMREAGLHQDVDQRICYLLALCYSVVAGSKGVQHVYKDAFLGKSTPIGEPAAEDLRRIGAVVKKRSREAVGQELDRTLGCIDFSEKILPLLQEALRRWVGNGLALMETTPESGLVYFIELIRRYLAKYRKRSNKWVRLYIDLFSYACKTAFYTCYANAWSILIPWLREHEGLDEAEVRFLSFWHHQNQAISLPHGRTAGGILYPTRHVVTVREQGTGGRAQRQTLAMVTERIGPSHLRDPFSGQVLALHPLSGIIMKDAGYRAILGKYFARQVRDPAKSAAYWDVVKGILLAATQYRQALDAVNARRRRTTRPGDADSLSDEALARRMETDLFKEFAAKKQARCATCAGRLQYVAAESPPESGEVVGRYACRKCRRENRLRITLEDIESLRLEI